MPDQGYKILPRGTRVGFVHDSRALEGVVKSHELNPNRKPGIGRVTYVIRWNDMFQDVRVPAARVHVLGDGEKTENQAFARDCFQIP